MSDRLKEMWEQQKKFMELLKERRGFPSFPLNLSQKTEQKFLKGITHECMHELFEANLLLMNSKDHRATEIKDFNREAYIEELVDALHYFFEIAILSGVTCEELSDAYLKKGEINVSRIESGY